MSATKASNYFESFGVGDIFEHRRGRTFSQDENARWSQMTLNTAQSHWNHESMKNYFGGSFELPIMNAAIVLAVAIGLSSGDVSENAFQDFGLRSLRMPTPSFPGDTVWARSTVLSVAESPTFLHSGHLTYRIDLRNQRDEQVCSVMRELLVKKEKHWAEKDAAFAQAHWGR